MVSGQLVYVWIQVGAGSETITNSVTGGQTWTAHTAITQTNQTARAFSAIFNGTWSANPAFTFGSSGSLTCVMHVFSPSVGGTFSATAETAQAGVTTTNNGVPFDSTISEIASGAASRVAIFSWGQLGLSSSTWALQTGGFSNAGTAQYRNTSSIAGAVSVAYKVQSAAGATGSVTNRASGASGNIYATASIAFSETIATPSWDTGPTWSAIDDNTGRVTYDANASSANIYCAAWPLGTSAPADGAAIEAHSGAIGSGTEATTGSSDTIDIDISGGVPGADWYCTLKTAGGLYTSVASGTLVGKCQSAPTGKQQINCPTGLTSIASGSQVDLLNALITPDVAVGDIPTCDLITTPTGFSVTIGLDGYVSYTDTFDTSRQYINCWYYDASVGANMATDNDLDFWPNNLVPGCTQTSLDTAVVMLVGAAFSYDLDSECSDGEADTLTSTKSGTLPNGLTLNGTTNVTSGTPDTENESGVTITYTVDDGHGATATKIRTYFPIESWTFADWVGSTKSAAEAGIASQTHGSVTVNASYECNAMVDAGDVISTDPVAMSEVAPFTEVELLVSAGRCRKSQGMRHGFGLGH